jgi:hypothetical protein
LRGPATIITAPDIRFVRERRTLNRFILRASSYVRCLSCVASSRWPRYRVAKRCGVFQEPRGLGSEPLLLAMNRYFIHLGLTLTS